MVVAGGGCWRVSEELRRLVVGGERPRRVRLAGGVGPGERAVPPGLRADGTLLECPWCAGAGAGRGLAALARAISFSSPVIWTRETRGVARVNRKQGSS
jgi:hypothetical protein